MSHAELLREAGHLTSDQVDQLLEWEGRIKNDSQIAQNIRYFVELLIGDRDKDFYNSIETAFIERVGEIFRKYNIQTKNKITVSDGNGIRQDIPKQYSDMILEIDNPQFQWDVLQELQDIAHEFHIKWNSAYEVGARQPRPKN